MSRRPCPKTSNLGCLGQEENSPNPDCVPKLWDEFDIDKGPIFHKEDKETKAKKGFGCE